MRRTLLALATAGTVVAGTVAVQLLPGAAPVARADGLKPYTGCDELLAHYRRELRASATSWGFGHHGGRFGMAEDAALSTGGAPVAGMPAAAQAAGEAVGRGGTGTNLQEQGVDEPDRAKLRDGRILVLAQGRLQVVSAEAKPRLLGSLRLGGEEWWGAELLLVGERALAVVPGWRQTDGGSQEPTRDGRLMTSVPAGTPTTRLVLLDVSTDAPRLLEEATYDGQYVSARLVGSTVRLVTTTRPQPRTTHPGSPGIAGQEADHRRLQAEALRRNQESAEAVGLDDVLPRVVRKDADGRVLAQGRAVSCKDTTHAEEASGASTLLVATLQPERGLGAVDRTAVTTDGDLVYASEDRLYVATSRWGTSGPARPADDAANAASTAPETDEVTTELHSFDTTDAARTRYLASGSVPGWVLGRWALSEHEGVLRVATTRQPPWDSGRAGETSSMVVKLAESAGRLVETGRVEGLGKTEQIQAVRYFGDIAAVVTFRQTDPLYLIDLSGAPKVLGELKVPGFSQYLHPLGDGLLLGLGMEADEKTGRTTGMQVSVFDVRDLSKPRQVDRLQLGNGWAEASHDSRAFGYDPQRRLATFSFSVYDERTHAQTASALGIRVEPDGSLREVGRLQVHPTAAPDRVLADADRLYAVSHSGVVAGDPATMRRLGAVDFARS